MSQNYLISPNYTSIVVFLKIICSNVVPIDLPHEFVPGRFRREECESPITSYETVYPEARSKGPPTTRTKWKNGVGTCHRCMLAQYTAPWQVQKRLRTVEPGQPGQLVKPGLRLTSRFPRLRRRLFPSWGCTDPPRPILKEKKRLRGQRTCACVCARACVCLHSSVALRRKALRGVWWQRHFTLCE